MKTTNKAAFHQSIQVGGANLLVYTEKNPGNIIEFIFEIENTPSKTLDFSIKELYKIYTFVQSSLKKIIETQIIPSIETDRPMVLKIEPEDDCSVLLAGKDKLYEHHLTRLSKLYTKNGYRCSYRKTPDAHLLQFYMENF